MKKLDMYKLMKTTEGSKHISAVIILERLEILTERVYNNKTRIKRLYEREYEATTIERINKCENTIKEAEKEIKQLTRSLSKLYEAE